MKLLTVACSRRDILKLATYSGSVTLLSLFSTACSPKIVDMETVTNEMISVLNHPEKAREIGSSDQAQSLLKRQTAEQLTKKLLGLIKLNPEEISINTLPSLSTRLSALVRQDFVDENVVIVNKWMLSRTELMLSAIISAQP